MSHRPPNRRRFLGAVGALPILAAVADAPTRGAAQEGRGAGSVRGSDAQEGARLKSLDLNAPEVVTQQKKMPLGKIGSLSVSRLISGSNLISMNMHARDLAYMRTLAAHYNPEQRIFMTLKKCEEFGVNTIVLKNHNFRQFRLSKYWTEWGGRMQWIADVITTDINQYERLVAEHLELGASAVYLWGGASDTWYYQKEPENIVKAFEIMKRYQVPVGIGAHRLEPIAFCVREGLAPDFYFKTLHHDRYWSAHPPEQRRYMEMFEPDASEHGRYHDNLFCHHPEATVALMQGVKVPWIAFKVLAAGAIPPADGFQYALNGGADFLCVGMFDFQVEEDVELVRRCAATAQARPRPWA